MRRRIIKNRIAFKITTGYTIIVFASMITIGLIFINQFKYNVFENKQQNLSVLADQVANKIAPDILTGAGKDSERYWDFVDSFANSRVFIVDKNGGVKNGSENTEFVSVTNEFNSSFVQRVMKGEKIHDKGFSSQNKESVLIVGAPVYDDNKHIIGAVFISSPMKIVDDSFKKAFIWLAGGILVAGVMSVTLGVFFSLAITRPLNKMNRLAVEMANGNYNIRTNIQKNDEVGELGVSLDSLAKKLGEMLDQLYQEKDKLKNLFESIVEGILSFNSEMKLESCNESFLKLFDYEQETNIETVVLKDLETAGLFGEFESVLINGNKSVVIVNRHNKKLKFIITPMKCNSDKIVGVVALVRDISESERLEQMRKDFIANVSHELRTPLTLIKSSAEALLDGIVTEHEEVNKFYFRILRETNGLARLVKDLTDLSKFQSGKMEMSMEEIDITALVTDVTKSMQMIANKKELKIMLEIQGNIPPVTGDYDRVKQLMIIFLDNSLKYSNSGSDVKVLLKANAKMLSIVVHDNGKGIPKEDIPYIWDRFYKVNKSRASADNGSGLGLSIAKHIIEAHNFLVNVKSELGKGTIIEVVLKNT